MARIRTPEDTPLDERSAAPAAVESASGAVPDSASSAETTHADSGSRFPIVGIGASAGGLNAFKKFFSQMPSDSGLAFILVPHLDPTHESLMVELLARQTTMPVCEARDAMQIEPNHVYIIPPNKYLVVNDGMLQLSSPTGRMALPTAIDLFFRSLAESQGERAIGIILSGTSSYGTPGLKEIKLAGGMVMVQEPETAEFDQMPRSAIASGVVDFVLPPEQMPAELLKYVQHPYVRGSLAQIAEETPRELLNSILGVLKTRTKYDFRSYRKNMLMRRVLRRMGLCHLHEMPVYLEFLRSHPDEVTALYNDLLIGVTDFFRDPEAFQVLQQRVIPELVASRTHIRVWVPACASGEEAYTLAMLFMEQFEKEKKPANFQIFATDIDERSLETARQGIYSDGAVTNLSPERLHRYFVRTNAQLWQVHKGLRESITFAAQNLISDAPFSKLDLISCRNLQIYLEPEVQAKVIRMFHFALADGGYLLLGPSESIGRDADLFEPVSKKWRVFRRISTARRGLLEIPIVATDGSRRLHPARKESALVPTIGYKELMQRLILSDYAPAAVLINHQYEIASVLGPLVDYLEFPPGEITRDVLAMSRQGLRTKLRAAIHKAIQTGETTVDHDARVRRDGVYVPCSISVKPVVEPKDATGLLLVTFLDRALSETSATEEHPSVSTDSDESALLQHLEQELKSTQDDLQSTVEEFESSTEELKVSNEEIMSMNEELQSANEELETSKEELQSLNEELTTVNNQLQEKLEELDRSHGDLTNLVTSSDVATVFLDTGLRIKSYTPSVAKLLNLRATDVGRLFSDLAPKIEDGTLLADCHAVLEKLVPNEKEVWTKDGPSRLVSGGTDGHGREERCYLRRILPYRTVGQQIDGVVITLVDITQRVTAEAQSQRLATVLWDSNDAVTLLDFDGDILAWNRGAERMYGYSEAEALQMNIREVVPEDKRAEALAYVERVRSDAELSTYETQRITKDRRILDVELTVTAYRDQRGRPIGLATTEHDITERKRAAIALQILNVSLEQRVAQQTREVHLLAKAVSHLGEGVMITDNELGPPGPRILFANEAICQMTGYSASELVGQTPRILQGAQTSRVVLDHLKQELSAGRDCQVELVNYRKDGTPFDVALYLSTVRDADERIMNFVSINRDITDSKRAAEQLRTSEERFRLLFENAAVGIAFANREGKHILCNRVYQAITGYSQEELEERTFAALTHPDDAQENLHLIRRLFEGELPSFEITHRYLKKSGSEVWVHKFVSLLHDKTGNCTHILTIVSDISASREAERTVHDREESLRAILNTASDAIITIDHQGLITKVNPATDRMFGYTSDELLGQNVRLLMPAPYHDEHDGYIRRFLETHEPRIIGTGREVMARRKDGSTFPVDLSVSQVDHMNLFTGIVRDVSQRKELQKQVLEIASEEQQRIGHELHDGTQQELTGLTLLAGSLRDLLKAIPAKYQSGKTSWTIDAAGIAALLHHAERLSQRLMEANRNVQQLAHGIMPVQIDALGLRSALQELANSTDGKAGVSCRFECPEGVSVSSNVTATHLYRIAQEAVTNALRHGQANHVEIRLRRLGAKLELEVSDNGKGFEVPSGRAPMASEGIQHMGLRIMDYRANLIGGGLTIERGDKGGIIVRCTILNGGSPS